jgi:hypothetical protein
VSPIRSSQRLAAPLESWQPRSQVEIVHAPRPAIRRSVSVDGPRCDRQRFARAPAVKVISSGHAVTRPPHRSAVTTTDVSARSKTSPARPHQNAPPETALSINGEVLVIDAWALLQLAQWMAGRVERVTGDTACKSASESTMSTQYPPVPGWIPGGSVEPVDRGSAAKSDVPDE